MTVKTRTLQDVAKQIGVNYDSLLVERAKLLTKRFCHPNALTDVETLRLESIRNVMDTIDNFRHRLFQMEAVS